MHPAGVHLDEEQHVDASEPHGLHMQDVARQDALGLRGQERTPRRAGPSRAGSTPALLRIVHTVLAAMLTPSRLSSPCTRR